MKTARIKSNPYTLLFQNFDRISEDELFREAMERLYDAGAALSEQTDELPYLTRCCGWLDGIPFELRLDLSEGVELYCEDEQTIQRLQHILE